MTPNEVTQLLIHISGVLRDGKHDEAQQALAELEEISQYLTLLEIEHVNNNARSV